MLVVGCAAKKLELTELEKFGFGTVRPTNKNTLSYDGVLFAYSIFSIP